MTDLTTAIIIFSIIILLLVVRWILCACRAAGKLPSDYVHSCNMGRTDAEIKEIQREDE